MHPTADPDDHPAWRDALVLVNRDLAVSEPGLEPLALLDFAENGIYVGLPSWGSQGNALFPSSDYHEVEADAPAATPDQTLLTIADAGQESVMEYAWRAWPVCPVHLLGMHPRPDPDAGGRASWWCRGRDAAGHVEAAIGELTALPSADPRSKSERRRQRKARKP
ncbi:hypothetical protein [Streptacidiphilus sp. PAMC 29251]|jgi:hypothetical protein